MAPKIRSEIEISRPPAEVRSVFFDFSRYPEWHTGFNIAGHKGPETTKGDKLSVNAGGFKFSPTVLANSTEEFRWIGSIPYIFEGEHYFRFEESKQTPGGTTFINGEDFAGLLSFLYGPTWSSGKQTLNMFQAFNESLKKRVEGA
ncbi:hypothetical protein PV05_06316 [Exophiala xenobiotica]|uniref:SRPBCC domain-containing protein n=1 Tax=Exophiala xenobiotica TaxID=348802 RepID=A0A0D2EEP5_9EURO|nr:uncharacterized protein PV05_06316 [Exophiala xenobiotica]KIW53908.1 hypothetical protein PV05_06316 [Exophiala xenobiotica]